eukprot:jgi/Orpsp1_1/1184417/evm.model.c7180000089435.1
MFLILKKSEEYALCRADKKLDEYITEYGVNINKIICWNKTPLFVLCENGNESKIKNLIEHGGADINKESYNGKTPLFSA